MTLTLFTLPPNKTVKLHICITKLHKCPLSPHVLDCFTFTSPAHCSIVTIAASNTTPDCCLNLRDCYKNSYPNLVLCCRKCPSDGKLHLYYLCSVSPFVLWLASPIFWPILPECQQEPYRCYYQKKSDAQGSVACLTLTPSPSSNRIRLFEIPQTLKPWLSLLGTSSNKAVARN